MKMSGWLWLDLETGEIRNTWLSLKEYRSGKWMRRYFT